MKDMESVINVVGRWSPSDVAFIRSLYYHAQEAENPAELHLGCILVRRDTAMNGWPSDTDAKFKIDLRFIGVKNLRLKEFGDGDTQIMGFNIVEVSDRGWEGVKYEIEDYEDDRIHFLCANIDVLNVATL